MSETGVDGNFKRLEEEVNRLLEILEQLRAENATLRERVATLESARQEADDLRQRLSGVEAQNRASLQRSEQVKERLEALLSRLEGAAL